LTYIALNFLSFWKYSAQLALTRYALAANCNTDLVFQLIPGYRGHVVDALKQLTIFDDTNVTADEKHHFKGLGKKKELILDEALCTVSIGKLSGIPMPDEMKVVCVCCLISVAC